MEDRKLDISTMKKSKSKIVYSGHLYESLNEKELRYIRKKMQKSIENLVAVLNTLTDGNQRKAISSLMNKTMDTFNDKIKGVNYIGKRVENQDDLKEIDQVRDKPRRSGRE